MKTFWVGCLLLSCLGAASAEPGNVRVLTSDAATPMLVMPVSVQEEPHRPTARLRDVLRQPFDEQQELASKPYRLSVEERQRMREQLRSQVDVGHAQDKP
jgi:hypothetical protein